ncbi:MAG: hypothetical protein JNL97_16480, partial [Verrucomicrobiales bacterium]|nr:hypothetical protein [Verrucomicrobiales bacterium]
AEVVLPPLPEIHHLSADGSTALHSARLPFELPFGVGLSEIRFDLAFTTAERPTPGEFSDALALSYQPPGTANTALVLVTDASGSLRLPDNPGGLEFPSSNLRIVAQPFPEFLGVPAATWVSFSVALSLPLAWQNCESGLWFDLFDNRTQPGAEAWLHDVRLVARDAFFLLESSASPAGPFSAEMGVTHDAEAGRFSLPLGGAARFFRLRADSSVRLHVLVRERDTWRFAYTFPDPEPRLESAPSPEGPYVPEPDARLNPTKRAFEFPTPGGAPRFYRVRARVRTAITRIGGAGSRIDLEFEYRPRVFALQSSAQPCGPYADDPSARFDTARQEIVVPRNLHVRMFRIAHSTADRSVRLRSVAADAARWTLAYEDENARTAAPQPRLSTKGHP